MKTDQATDNTQDAASEAPLLLGTMQPGMFGQVVSLDSNDYPDIAPEMTDRLREMGFAEGLEIEVLHQSPFGRDPIAVRVGQMTVALRRREANLVKVQLV